MYVWLYVYLCVYMYRMYVCLCVCIYVSYACVHLLLLLSWVLAHDFVLYDQSSPEASEAGGILCCFRSLFYWFEYATDTHSSADTAVVTTNDKLLKTLVTLKEEHERNLARIERLFYDRKYGQRRVRYAL